MGTSSAGLTSGQADEVYDVLVQHCGAAEASRSNFAHHQTGGVVTEWRFIGALGFGGKFWRTDGRRPDGSWGELWRVDCYTEDRTPARRAAITAANQALWECQLRLVA